MLPIVIVQIYAVFTASENFIPPSALTNDPTNSYIIVQLQTKVKDEDL